MIKKFSVKGRDTRGMLELKGDTGRCIKESNIGDRFEEKLEDGQKLNVNDVVHGMVVNKTKVCTFVCDVTRLFCISTEIFDEQRNQEEMFSLLTTIRKYVGMTELLEAVGENMGFYDRTEIKDSRLTNMFSLMMTELISLESFIPVEAWYEMETNIKELRFLAVVWSEGRIIKELRHERYV